MNSWCTLLLYPAFCPAPDECKEPDKLLMYYVETNIGDFKQTRLHMDLSFGEDVGCRYLHDGDNSIMPFL
jgi:hypothetical protein